MIQIYGQFQDYGSFAQISRALARECQRAGLEFSIWNTNSFDARYLDCPASWNVAMNSSAMVGIYVGYAPGSPSWLQGHDHKYAVTMCESNRIPPEWASVLNRDIISLVPSTFVYETFLASGVRPDLVRVIRHGVPLEHLSKPAREMQRSTPTFLHVSGAKSFPARKGTAALLYAAAELVKAGRDFHLYLHLDKTEQLSEALKTMGLEHHVSYLSDRYRKADLMMRQLARGIDAVIQPSRGEGFGLIPLEARTLGIPAILTNATGHQEHFQPGVDVEVATGSMMPLATQGNQSGMAPTVQIEAITRAMNKFLDNRRAITQHAQTWAEQHTYEWTWPMVLKPLITTLRRQVAGDGIQSGARQGFRGV